MSWKNAFAAVILTTFVGFLAACQREPTGEIEVFEYLDQVKAADLDAKTWRRQRNVEISSDLFKLLNQPAFARIFTGDPVLLFDIFGEGSVKLTDYDIQTVDGARVLSTRQSVEDVEIWIDRSLVYGRIEFQGGLYVFDSTGRGDFYRISEFNDTLDLATFDAVIPTGRITPKAVEPLRQCDDNPFGIPINKPIARLDMGIVYSAEARRKMPSIELAIRSAVGRMDGAMGTPNYWVNVETSNLSQTTFTETASTRNDLDRLQRSAEIARLRNNTNSDLIAFVGDYSGICGRGYLNENVVPGDAQWGFSLMHFGCLSNHTLAHEVGHNIGLRHDEAVDSAGSINHGFVAHMARKRSIMAYNNACSAKGYNCPRLSRYSSPKYRVTKQENFGNARSNNLEVICRAAPTVAGFR